jgi:hypothetical protein
MAVDFSAIISLSVSLSFFGVEMSSISSSQSLEVSVYRGVKVFVISGYRGVRVSGCAVKILAQSLVRLHFC